VDLGDEPALDELLTLLDRLPLAIELVAPRLRLMPVRDVSDRFALLSAPGPGRAPGRERHATLRAVLDGSWELLDDALRDALTQLSVFEGGFDLAPAQAILDLPELPVLDAIQALVDRSLVVPGSGRFSLLVSVAAYAGDRLVERGGRDAAERRHEAWFVRKGVSDAIVDLPNRLAACRRVIARGDPDAAAAALDATAWRMIGGGPCSVPLALAHEVLAMPGLTPAGRSVAWGVIGMAHTVLGDHDQAQRCLDEALALAEEAGDRRLGGLTHNRRAISRQRLGRHVEAESDLHAALRELVDPAERAGVLGNLGAQLRGRDPERAEQVLREALALHDLAMPGTPSPSILGNLGVCLLRLGRLDEAEHWLKRTVAASATGQGRGFPADEAVAQVNLGQLALVRGRLDDAEQAFLRALELVRGIGHRQETAVARVGLAEVAEARADWATALHQLEAALAVTPSGDLRKQILTAIERSLAGRSTR
jgi:tetratricopeptide (TPR) repeat protein